MNRREKEGNIKTVIWKKFDWRIASWSEIVAKKWARDISYFLLPNIPIQNKIIKIVVFLWCLLVFFVIWHLLQLSQGQTSSEHFSPKPCRYVFWICGVHYIPEKQYKFADRRLSFNFYGRLTAATSALCFRR